MCGTQQHCSSFHPCTLCIVPTVVACVRGQTCLGKDRSVKVYVSGFYQNFHVSGFYWRLHVAGFISIYYEGRADGATNEVCFSTSNVFYLLLLFSCLANIF